MGGGTGWAASGGSCAHPNPNLQALPRESLGSSVRMLTSWEVPNPGREIQWRDGGHGLLQGAG